MNNAIKNTLCCPKCKSNLDFKQDSKWICLNKDCKKEYFIINRIPYLIDRDTDFLKHFEKKEVQNEIY